MEKILVFPIQPYAHLFLLQLIAYITLSVLCTHILTIINSIQNNICSLSRYTTKVDITECVFRRVMLIPYIFKRPFPKYLS